MEKVKVGIIGGSGLYELDGVTVSGHERIDTPFGPPSDLVTCGSWQGVDLFFLPRHGRGHRLLPSEVNYRANIYALKSLGAQWCISVSAVGSLREDLRPGDIVIPDQLIDRTNGRASTFFGGGIVAHVSFAEPFCPVLRSVLIDAAAPVARENGFSIHDGGTYVCMEGPAFSTRAESHLHRSWGASLIGMTNLPEAKLAREAELAYATMALVTDYDCWRDDGEHVTVVNVIDVLRRNTVNAKSILARVLPLVQRATPSALAANALGSALFCDLATVDREAIECLRPLISRYLPRA